MQLQTLEKASNRDRFPPPVLRWSDPGEIAAQMMKTPRSCVQHSHGLVHHQDELDEELHPHLQCSCFTSYSKTETSLT